MTSSSPTCVKQKLGAELTVTLKMHAAHMVVMKPIFWWRRCTSFWLWFEALFGSLACCQLCLFVLAINDGAAKLLSQLNNGGLQGLMGSFINGCQWLANWHHYILFARVDIMADLIGSVKIWLIIVVWIHVSMTQHTHKHTKSIWAGGELTMIDEL